MPIAGLQKPPALLLISWAESNMASLSKKQLDMTEGNIFRLLITFAIPLFVGDLLQQGYNVVDSMILGNMVSKQALAAVSATTNIVNVLVGFFSGISVGATVVVSRNFGAKDFKRLNIALRTIIWITLVIGISFTAIGLLGTPMMLRLLKTPADVLPDASAYLRIYFSGVLGLFLYNMCGGILRAIGDSRRPMMVLGLCSVMNIGLDLFFIKVFGMGVEGAAYATIIAQFVSAGVLFRFILNVEAFQPLDFRKPVFDKETIKQIAVVGVPIGIRKSVISFSNTVVVSFINRFGSGAMAAWGIQNRVDSLISLTIQSMSTAITTFVAQNVGAGKRERISKGSKICMGMTFGLCTFYIILFVVFRVPIIKLFNQDPDVIEYGCLIFTTMIPLQFINSITHTCCGILQGYGESKGPMYIMLFCYVVLRQLYLQLLWPYFQSFRFVMLAFPFAWLCCCVMTAIYTARKIKKIESAWTNVPAQ